MGFYYMISWIPFLALSHICFSAAYDSTNQNHPPSAMIVGTVYCDTCFHQNSSRNYQLISGASVMVDCSNQATKTSFRKAVKTDKDGVFRVQLPSEIGKHVKKIKGCSVKLLSSNEPFCAVAASATSSSFHLKSTTNKIHVFSSGFFTFRPLNQPELCYQRPSVEGSSNFEASKDTIPSSPLPSVNISPLLPLLPPLPTLPTLPPLPNLPNIPQLPPPATPSNPLIPGIPKQFPTNETKP
ncbi:pollen-specific protein-like At4g18596 [Dendrobium catenatum]|uniref:Major pollen allergen Pla l 1 n=1 Tax=Dendrobium catenatum TaxID=906689 RepID=A0A2I0WZP1_9ASPA|nr:pollen-specific protein-like At4g18596 [Dendrobium catenatum]PKU81111.1 Major pollen allergen Pla l 1 [Dendrobium catenatum]